MKHLVSTHELSGNYTVIIDDTQNDVYLGILDCEYPGITMKAHLNGSLMMDVSEMFKTYNVKIYPDISNINDSTVGYSDAYESNKSIRYRSRVVRIDSDKLFVFAPIILYSGDQIPDVFILYRKDLSSSGDLKKPDDVVTVIDLHQNNISEYIQPKDLSSAYIHGNNKYIKGIDTETGQFVKSEVYSDSIIRDEKKTENIIYQAFKDKKMLYNNIINISFIVHDDDIYGQDSSTETSAYLYWGRYANLSEIDKRITIENKCDASIDDRDNDIFIFNPINDQDIHNTIKYKGSPSKLDEYNLNDVLLKHHTGGYECVSFDSEGCANIKFGYDNNQKYVDLNRTTYTIDSYVHKLPSMSFEWPLADCSLYIRTSLNGDYSKFVGASSSININWVSDMSGVTDKDHAILLTLPITEQLNKFCNIVEVYFNVHYTLDDFYSSASPTVSLTARNDNIMNFDEIYFQKTSKLNLIGLYKIEDMSPDEKISYKKRYKYFFTGEDSYAKIEKNVSSKEFLLDAKNKYIELSDISNTRLHDKIHEVFADADFYYIRTGETLDNDNYHYKCGGVINGSTVSLYTMKETSLYTKTHLPVGDFIDIRSIGIGESQPEGVCDDRFPVDVKTRNVWCDYASIDKNGDNLIPSIASSVGVIDVYSSDINQDSWSYGQILYNRNEPTLEDVHFKNTHFQSKTLEDAYILNMFGPVFDEAGYSWYKTHRLDFVKALMTCMCYFNINEGIKETPLLVFEESTEDISLYKRFKSYLNVHNDIIVESSLDSSRALSDSDISLLFSTIGEYMNNISITTISNILKSYLSTCDESVLQDITMSVSPTLYDDEMFCMLFGVPFTTDIIYADYTFKSIIIPCPRFVLKLSEDDNIYQKAITQFIRNDNARTIIITTFLDTPCIMPFYNIDNDYRNTTMFGYFDRNYIKHIGTKTAEDVMSNAFNINYIRNAAELTEHYSYKNVSTTSFNIAAVNYIESEEDVSKYIYSIDGEENDAMRAASTIVNNTSLQIGILSHGAMRGILGERVYPQKIILYSTDDEAMKYPIWTMYTFLGSSNEIGRESIDKLSDIGIHDRFFDMYAYADANRDRILEADMLPFDDTYNNDIRHISSSNVTDYIAVALSIDIIDPLDISQDNVDSLISSMEILLSYGSSYYYFNSLMANAKKYNINEYTSNTDMFIETKSGELNSMIRNIVYKQCYPSDNQLFTYSIVDNDVVNNDQSYIHMNQNEDNTGILYNQYLTLYNDDTNTIEHLQTKENIFDTTDILRVPLVTNRYFQPTLNYRTQRFVSLVVYDKKCTSDYITVSNIKASPTILASKEYVTNGRWINYKKNRSSVDVKLYPSILYGSLLYNDLKPLFDKLYIHNDSNNQFYLSEDNIISYVDKMMFHLYDYNINTYSDNDSSEFKISAQSPKSTDVILNYDSKKNYEQSYKNISKHTISFKYKMSLR